MKEWRKTLLTVICVLGMGASFAARLWEDPDMVGEIKAPVHVNIEIDRDRAKNVYILARVIGGKARFVPSPTTGFDGSAPTVVLYSAIFSDRDIPIIWDLFLLVPEEEGPATLAAIEGISVFIGNKLFYFSRNDIAAFQGQNENAHTLYRLPGLSYEKSFAGPWINWYGDLNMIVKAALAFFAQPLKFAAAWAFLLALLISRWERAAGLAGLLGGGGGAINGPAKSRRWRSSWPPGFFFVLTVIRGTPPGMTRCIRPA
ncbi:MAG: hypothetical protein LBG84_00030 [Treponema sp.]|jgi:hypothetical protein|nr:hypothetical protein [Treponema sp.]